MSHPIQLHVFHELPEGLLEKHATQLHEVLPGPSLIFLSGQHEEYLFVSVLLHGNEVTGWDAIRALLDKYRQRSLPRSLCLFIGNISAAKQGLRHLPDQQDYNRIWKGDEDSAGHQMARDVLHAIRDIELFAAIDIHNNTGKNPHYACINRLDAHYLYLATLFSRTVVYFIRPDSVLSMAMTPHCPSVTVECGQPGQPQGMMHAVEFIDACLHLSAFPDHPVASQDMDVYHTVATVRIPQNLVIDFGDEDVDVCLLPDIDRFNFNELPAGTAFGRIRQGGQMPFDVRDEQGREVSARYFEINDGWIQIRKPMMPSMLTLDRDIIRQDCLCYLMERLEVC